ncbi:hypothetical protein ES332_D13G276600v1 [Gossypium tomentosum]|uniref:Uncharacterized protein n=1 Tax=Gossypium tomentosum TaxID=34277 RepID=A0A5D2I2T7_GOSTO|nr:hypothetical protein ES332_D13G276600v1 [Gossypium tomentosum]TYH36621.1 hypothetical protein ES332_D13G276600v1 [Gossypium tomentosum]TYH36622.1 hypothetical protein ES332_D13G276600v1 [Gossypium tomentosum]TYH36623.1 hypothetical protein ES332_D13G276600v1 [Gossypium tomentosum]
MKQPECKMGEDKELKDSSLMKQPECNKGEGEGEDKELKDSSLMKQPECNKGEGEGEGEDTELKEDDISQDSDCFSGLSNYEQAKRWCYVCLRKTCQRNEQVALLLKVLKCDKSEIPSIYEFRNVYHFHAYLTLDEAENLSELGEVGDIDWLSMSEVASKAKRTRSRTSNGILKPKKQKTSMGSILSQRRQNKEKWRYNEDFEPEPESDIKDLEEEDLPEDDYDDSCRDSSRYEGYSCRQGYYGFDASGKRWYEVSLVDEKNQDYHKALLVDVLKWDSCKSIYSYKANHLFEARMSEEEADKVAGLEEVEYVEPRRYIKIMDLN